MYLFKKISLVFTLVWSIWGICQQANWQQRADYQMSVDFDVEKFQYSGQQQIAYQNNSTDTLNVVFYHLYLNAFKPQSEMDIRLQTIKDPDRRMIENGYSKIAKLNDNESGFIDIQELKQDGIPVTYQVFGTILKVNLHTPILPQTQVRFTMKYKAQIPKMIRRMGRDSVDGIALSMAQWYPKIAQYDKKGWHTAQYLGREFYGVWGDFDVKINIDKKYILAGTGVLQGTENKEKSNKKTWHFKAYNVHDFSWAADADYHKDELKTPSGKTLYFYYKKYNENWKKIQPKMVEVFEFFQQKIGAYPWDSYSFIQAGDGGMEYAMCTFISGDKNFSSLLYTAIHELGHAWFQHIFASNESAFPWFDEGFTSYIEDWAKVELIGKGNLSYWKSAYDCYLSMVHKNFQEVPTTYADRYDLNVSYSQTSYCKGEVFLSQLKYLIGKENLQKTFKRFYNEFAMKHPEPIDFIRCAEKESNMQLMWYYNEFMQTTNTIDYAISHIEKISDKKTRIVLQRIGKIPMPIEVCVKLKNLQKRFYYIPTMLTLGTYRNDTLPSWAWANPFYEFEIDVDYNDIQEVILDNDYQIADKKRENNYIKLN